MRRSGELFQMSQSTLFENVGPGNAFDAEQVILYALGDFQSRGKVLSGRQLPLDRLRGAIKRAAEALGFQELGDERAVSALRSLGAEVRQVPPFVAKHPFRVTVDRELADRALAVFNERRESRTREPAREASQS